MFTWFKEQSEFWNDMDRDEKAFCKTIGTYALGIIPIILFFWAEHVILIAIVATMILFVYLAGKLLWKLAVLVHTKLFDFFYERTEPPSYPVEDKRTDKEWYLRG